MSLKTSPKPQRRRGNVLEEALLDAAWAELTEGGYEELTMDAVAARAGTSRAVLYRRWPGKPQLVHAALEYVVSKDSAVAPDTGTLRGDVIALLRQANKKRIRTATLLFTSLGDYYRQTGTNLSDLIASAQGGRDSVLQGAIQRAVARGEVRPDQISERIARLPIDLFRHEVLMTLQPVSDEVIEEIVDTIFLPLVHRGNPLNGPQSDLRAAPTTQVSSTASFDTDGK
jgi:AcrR family transcriptional regulator